MLYGVIYGSVHSGNCVHAVWASFHRGIVSRWTRQSLHVEVHRTAWWTSLIALLMKTPRVWPACTSSTCQIRDQRCVYLPTNSQLIQLHKSVIMCHLVCYFFVVVIQYITQIMRVWKLEIYATQHKLNEWLRDFDIYFHWGTDISTVHNHGIFVLSYDELKAQKLKLKALKERLPDFYCRN